MSSKKLSSLVISFLFSVSVSCFGMNDEDYKKAQKNLINACKIGSIEAVHRMRTLYGPSFLNDSVACPIKYMPIEVACTNQHWKLVLWFIDNKLNIDHKQELSTGCYWFSHFFYKQDNKQKIGQIIECLTSLHKNGKNINEFEIGKKTPIQKYLFYNMNDIDHNDEIIKWFIQKGVHFSGTSFNVNQEAHNNIFNFPIAASIETIVTITKVLIYHKLENV